MGWLSAIIGAIGGLLGGGMQMHGQNRSNQMQYQSHQDQLAWEREAAQMGQAAINEENQRRSKEAQFRAAKLEDVAGMFGKLEGIGEMGDVGQGQMREMAQMLMSGNDSANLEKSAMHALSRNSGMLDASLAGRGLFSSGYAAQNQQGLASDTMMGLARDISQNRQQNMGMASGLLGQAGQWDMSRYQHGLAGRQFDMDRLAQIAQLYMDDSFGANAPMRATGTRRQR